MANAENADLLFGESSKSDATEALGACKASVRHPAEKAAYGQPLTLSQEQNSSRPHHVLEESDERSILEIVVDDLCANDEIEWGKITGLLPIEGKALHTVRIEPVPLNVLCREIERSWNAISQKHFGPEESGGYSR